MQVASWYTLVIYTASMPEYADPVIDWLDNGRGLFAKRLYRDACHLQPSGSYVKDLSLVDPDLSRVCFMDNSPISYSWNKGESWRCERGRPSCDEDPDELTYSQRPPDRRLDVGPERRGAPAQHPRARQPAFRDGRPAHSRHQRFRLIIGPTAAADICICTSSIDTRYRSVLRAGCRVGERLTVD